MHAGLSDTGAILVVFPQHGHEGAVMNLHPSVCLCLKRKQEQNFAKPHRVNAQTEVPGARWTHKYQVLAVPPMKWLAGERMTQNTLDSRQLLVTNHKRRVELKVSDPLGRLTRHDCVHKRMYLNLEIFSRI
jgi:hypothetical protein